MQGSKSPECSAEATDRENFTSIEKGEISSDDLNIFLCAEQPEDLNTDQLFFFFQFRPKNNEKFVRKNENMKVVFMKGGCPAMKIFILPSK